MNALSKDFLYFLEKNFPTVSPRANSKDLTESAANSIISTYGHRYNIYLEIPIEIRNRNGDIVPKDVLNGNITVYDYVEKEKAKYKAEEKATNELIGFSVSMLALGYATDTVTTLAEDRAAREAILREAAGNKLTPEQMLRWLATRQSDIDAITRDWQNNQPEKYALHLAKSISRAQKRLGRTTENADKEALTAEIKELENELKQVSKGLNTRGLKQNMVDYLRAQPQQAALRHLEPDTLALLTKVMEEQGIRIEAVRGNARSNRLDLSHGSLTESLKKDFAAMKESGSLLRKAVLNGKETEERIIKRAAQKETKKKTRRLAQAKRYAAKQNLAG